MKNLFVDDLCLMMKLHRSRRRLRWSGVFISRTVLAILLVYLLNLSMSRAENLTADRADIISQIEHAQSLAEKEEFEQAIRHLVAAYNLADSGRDYLSSAALVYLIAEVYEKRGRRQQALINYEQGLRILTNRKAGAARNPGQRQGQRPEQVQRLGRHPESTTAITSVRHPSRRARPISDAMESVSIPAILKLHRVRHRPLSIAMALRLCVELRWHCASCRSTLR